MSTESLKYAKFDHPRHGSYQSPEAVLADDRLSHSEKMDVLQEWQSSLTHILRNEPDAPEVKRTHRSLDETIEKLAAIRT